MFEDKSVGGFLNNTNFNSFLDIVYVAVLNHLHHNVALKALEAKKHVLVEKSMGLNSKEVGDIVEKARESGKFCMEVRSLFKKDYQIDSREFGLVSSQYGTRSRRSLSRRSWAKLKLSTRTLGHAW